MNWKKVLRQIIAVTLTMVFLVGCGSTAPSPAVQAPAATPASGSPMPPPPLVAPTPAPKPEPGAPGLGDSLYPGFGNGGYDVQHYLLDLSVSDVSAGALIGITTIEAEATADLSSFNLDFIGFTIEGITVDEQPAEFRRNGQELTITPARPLQAGEDFRVKVTYSGAPKQIKSVAMPVPAGWVTFDGGSFVLSEPDGAANYYPVNDHPLDKASYTFRITVPKPFEVAANGVLAETIDHGATTTFVWEAHDPMASYLSTVDISQFEVETEPGPNGIPLRNTYAVGLDREIRKPFARQAEMLALYSRIFGPYPFEAYGSVVMNTKVGSAMETQTLSLFGVDTINLKDIPQSELVVAHEAAHQWLGDSVSLADWRDIWLNESFATYAEGLWIEHTEGREALDGWVKDTYKHVVDSREKLVPPGKPLANDLFNDGVYSWGALGLHALRLEVSDNVFFDILRTYTDRFKGRNVRTSDFIAVAEEVSGQNLHAFFDSWLYSEKIAPIPALGLKAD